MMTRACSSLIGVAAIALLAVIGITACRPSAPSSRKLETLHDQQSHTNQWEELSEEEIDARLEAYGSELDRDPDNRELFARRLEFALYYRPRAAVEQCKPVVKKDPDHYFAISHLAAAYLRLGELNKALHYAGQAYRVRPDAESRMLVAKVYEAQGQRRNAVQMYRRILEKDKDHKGARRALKAMGEIL